MLQRRSGEEGGRVYYFKALVMMDKFEKNPSISLAGQPLYKRRKGLGEGDGLQD